MKNLNHPNVVEVYELYIDEFRGNVYIVMELIEGLEMYEAIKKLGSYNGNIYWLLIIFFFFFNFLTK